MLCPFCQHPESQVIDSRQSLYNQISGIRRRRQCSQCLRRFSSFEMTIHDLEGIEPATLDGLLAQITKLFKDAPRTNYKALQGPLTDNQVSIPINGYNQTTIKPETSTDSKPTVKLSSKDIKEAMRRARQQLARELDELDASEFDDEDFD